MSANADISDKPLLCVVDDDSLIRNSTRRLICLLGFRVEAFASAQDFANSDCVNKTACLILDMRMPGVDGLELQRRLSETGKLIPIVFVSAYADEEQERRAREAGAVDFLRKPFTEEALLNAIRAALKREVLDSAKDSEPGNKPACDRNWPAHDPSGFFGTA